jgi:hypothetical protein
LAKLKLASFARAENRAGRFCVCEPNSRKITMTSLPPSSGRPLTRALVDALGEICPETNDSKLRCIIDKLIAKAADGDLSAIREIFDRIDGKASAGGAAGEEAKKVVFQWKGDE